ncbi:MAG: type I secretion system permease/ATPase [Gammaproteobacteria bacterium]
MKEFQHLINVTRRVFVRTSIFSFFTNLLILTLPIYMLQIFDRVIPSKSQETLIYLTLIALAVIVVFGFLDVCRTYLLTALSFWIDKEISSDTLMRSPDEILHGDENLFIVMTDTVFLRSYISSSTFVVLFDIPWSPIYLIALWLLHPIVGAFSIIGAIALFALAFINNSSTKTLISEANTAQIQTQADMTNLLRNAETIQAMGMQGAIYQRWDNDSTKTYSLLQKASVRSSVIVAISRVLRIALQILILCIGAYLVTQEQFTPGMMIAASILMSRALAPIEQSIAAWREFIKGKDAYRRVKAYISRPKMRSEGIDLPTPKGEISVEHLYFRFPQAHQWTLMNIHFQLHPGEMLAVIGPSAAGKSTLARLVAGVLRPTQGHIRLDNAEIYNWSRKQVGQHIGYVAQNVELFNASVKENIARMQDVDEKAVIKAAKLAGTHDLILRMTHGYETLIGEAGRNLSGGQKQYVALARALYHDPKILILDEPTAFMDEKSQRDFLHTLNRIKTQGITIVIVTHKAANIQASDKLLYLLKGKPALYGKTRDVIDKVKDVAPH